LDDPDLAQLVTEGHIVEVVDVKPPEPAPAEK